MSAEMDEVMIVTRAQHRKSDSFANFSFASPQSPAATGQAVIKDEPLDENESAPVMAVKRRRSSKRILVEIGDESQMDNSATDSSVSPAASATPAPTPGKKRGRKLGSGKKKVVKDEPESREGSVNSSTGSVATVTDGKMKGMHLDRNARDTIEFNSCILYPYPRYMNFTDGRHTRSMKNIKLDLVEEGDKDTEDGQAVDSEYTMDAVLALDNSSVLIDWAGFKFPTWHERKTINKGPIIDEFIRRQAVLDCVFKELATEESLSAMRRYYPNWNLIQTVDYNEYVKHPGIVYIAGLRKRERQINEYYSNAFQRPATREPPLLMFEDWTDFQNSSIPTMEYLVDSETTEQAAEFMEDIMAERTGCTCSKRCGSGPEKCCTMIATSNMGYIKPYVVGNTVQGNFKPNEPGAQENAPYSVDLYECGDACACDKSCRQRVVQNGRKWRLVVFKHHEKGWTLRAGQRIPSGGYVCEYLGVMMSATESYHKDSMYQIELQCMSKSTRKNRLMVIDARLKGNEARFISHSCDPNLFAFRVHYDVAGRTKRHIAMYAARDIEAGEELTYDYYTAFQDPTEFRANVTFACKCRSPSCRGKMTTTEMPAHKKVKKEVDE